MNAHLMSLMLLLSPFVGVGVGFLAHTLWSLWSVGHD